MRAVWAGPAAVAPPPRGMGAGPGFPPLRTPGPRARKGAREPAGGEVPCGSWLEA